MHFAENQLSPSLIGLSPLSTGHPLHFQLKSVRASTESYLRFTLPMDSSLGFGSTACDWTPYSDSLSLRLPLIGLTLPHTVTRWLILQKARHRRTSLLWLFVDQRFQVLFHSPPGVLFTFPGSSLIHAGFPGSGVTRETQQETDNFRVRGSYPLRRAVHRTLPLVISFVTPWGSDVPSVGSHNPTLATPSGFNTSTV